MTEPHQHADLLNSRKPIPFTTLNEAREAARQLAGPNAEIVHRYLQQQHQKQSEAIWFQPIDIVDLRERWDNDSPDRSWDYLLIGEQLAFAQEQAIRDWET
jgi:hypothetical protein